MLWNALRLWTACRNTSNPHRISGYEKLDVDPVTDHASPWYGHQPMPPIIIAQKECIVYTKILRPLSKAVLKLLHTMITANQKKYWLTIYLTIFILLHSCSMLTRRDADYARQISLPVGEPRSLVPGKLRILLPSVVLQKLTRFNPGRVCESFKYRRSPQGSLDIVGPFSPRQQRQSTVHSSIETIHSP